jgi:phosphoglycolate phosphatase
MIGDREHDVRGAAVHGVATIGVLWGYGSRAELQAAGAAAIVETVADLRKSLLG